MLKDIEMMTTSNLDFSHYMTPYHTKNRMNPYL